MRRLGPAFALLTIAVAAVGHAETPRDPHTVVGEWVARLKRIERVHAGGRQRLALQSDAARLLPPMIEAMADDETYVGRSLARLAALAPPDVAVPLLSRGLDHAEGHVREFCAHALGRLGSPSAIPALLTAIRKGRISHVEGFGAIVAIGGDPARRTLIGLLPGYSKNFRQGVADALAHLPHPDTVEALTKGAADRVDVVAARAILALARLAELGHHGGAPAVEAVAARLDAKTPELRHAALHALGVLGGERAYEALVSHARRVREESAEAWTAATFAREGPPPVPAIGILVRELATGRDDDRRRRAARALARARDEESAAALRAVVANEQAPIGLVHQAVDSLARRGESIAPESIRDRLRERADGRSELVVTLDRASARDTLRALAQEGTYASGSPPGGPFFFLAFYGTPADVPMMLDLAAANSRSPAALIDLHFALLAIGGRDTVDALLSALPLLPAEDRLETGIGFTFGRRAWCAMTVRALVGRTFGYASDQASGTNGDAFRSALRWWKREGRDRDPAGWREGAAADALEHLSADSAERRENAIEALARAGELDAVAAHLAAEADPVVATTAARALAAADDPRGVEWLVTRLADAALADPILGSRVRPTRLEAIRALRRVAQTEFVYEDGRVYGEEEAIDVVMDETAAWKAWWERHRDGSPAAWRQPSWAAIGIDLAPDPIAPATLRRLADLLDAPDVPRWRREGALAELRRATGKQVLAVDLLTLERFAPGSDHPVFRWLAPRWRALL